jgi:hypothetical protein
MLLVAGAGEVHLDNANCCALDYAASVAKAKDHEGTTGADATVQGAVDLYNRFQSR